MSTPHVETVDRGPKAVSRSVIVTIPPEEIFARLADPKRHAELDGSGTVGDGVKGGPIRKVGDRFTVKMKMYGLPYRITSEVTRFEEGRDIEWRHPAGHTWRWQLEPLGDGRTRVTETWDYSGGRMGPLYKLMGIERGNVRGIEATLAGLQRRLG